MKVVLFCGGFGMRMRSQADDVPKPMVPIGYRPIVWHIMKYYAHYGHRDFVLCLGWKANVIKRYFLEYEETVSNDFVMRGGREGLELLDSDIEDWTITFVDTGHSACIGERLRRVRELVADEPMFFANYADGLTDLHLPDMVADFDPQESAGSFLTVRPRHTFHAVDADDDDLVERIRPIENTGVWMNGGFFLFTPEVFDYMRPGEDLVEEPFQRMIDRRRLRVYRYDGFWSCMDTYKEKTELEERALAGNAPWEVWNRPDRAVLRPIERGEDRIVPIRKM